MSAFSKSGKFVRTIQLGVPFIKRVFSIPIDEKYKSVKPGIIGLGGLVCGGDRTDAIKADLIEKLLQCSTKSLFLAMHLDRYPYPLISIGIIVCISMI
ncbi:hypothetical protein [Methanocella sp. MCL-LM]|uniref:hypothetical protein n=1 Tax=Methanocella sp. MCL-LM TaxID=3412035 RepID=UPI003C78FE88